MYYITEVSGVFAINIHIEYDGILGNYNFKIKFSNTYFKQKVC